MATPFDKYLANDLRDFAGLKITGSLPVKQEILNDLLQNVLADMQSPQTLSPNPSPSEGQPLSAEKVAEFDAKRLLKHLKKAEIRAEAGRLVLDFDVSVDG